MPPIDLSGRYGVPLAALGLALTSGCAERVIDGEGGVAGEPGDITGDWRGISITYGGYYGYYGEDETIDLPVKYTYDGCTYRWGMYLSIEPDGTGELTNSYSLDCGGGDYEYAYDESVPVLASPIPDSDDVALTIDGELTICDVGSKQMTCRDPEGVGSVTFKRR